jgi:hypothetical protein
VQIDRTQEVPKPFDDEENHFFSLRICYFFNYDFRHLEKVTSKTVCQKGEAKHKSHNIMTNEMTNETE